MSLDEVPWTLSRDDFDLGRVTTAKSGTSVVVIIPARDESTTIGPVLDSVFAHRELVDDVVVVDDHSSDDTATVAAHHGARVVHNEGPVGKGAAMRAGLAATDTDLVVYLDADVLDPPSDVVGRLIQPLLERPSIQLVKGYYERPLHHMPTGGGRVNELTARPVLSLLFPGLGEIRQPLAGETAARRGALEAVELDGGYSVEIALLIDVTRLFGVRALAQCDLEIRRHRNRPLDELRPMATDILRAALARYKVDLPEQL